MDDDTGGAGRLDEPSKLAGIRRLHIDHGGEPGHSEEWYETERLTGHITGRARATAASRPPAPTQSAVVLDWRHTDAAARPSALERLGRNLIARGYRPRQRDANAVAYTRAHAAELPVLAAPGEGLAPEPGLATGIGGEDPSGLRIGLRGDTARPTEPARWRSALRTSHRGGKDHPRPRKGLIVSGVVLGVLAISVAGIGSRLITMPARPPRANPDVASSTPIAAPGAMAATVSAAIGALERHVLNRRARNRALPPQRRVRHETRERKPEPSHPTFSSSGTGVTSARASSASSGPRVTASSYSSSNASPTYSSQHSYGGSSSSPAYSSQHSYGGSSSSPTYTSQPAARESAPAAPTTSPPQPAGPLGLGSQVGSDCNPKCS